MFCGTTDVSNIYSSNNKNIVLIDGIEMNERLNTELTQISALFMLISSILFVNTIVDIFDEANKEIPLMGTFLELVFLLALLSVIYSIIHDSFFPIKKKDEKNQITEKSFLIFTIINILVFLYLVIANNNPKTTNIFVKVIPVYNIILFCYLVISLYILLLLLINSLRKGEITKLELKKVSLWVSLFGLMMVGMVYFMYNIFKDSYDYFQMSAILALLFINVFTLIYFQKKEQSLYNYLIGSVPKIGEGEQKEELSKTEKDALLESHITTKVLILSGLVNMLVVVLFLGLIRLLLLDYKLL